MNYDQATTEIVYCFFPGGVAIKEVRLLMMYCWCLYCCYKKYITVAGLSFL
jgi:hypothetical protein